MAGDGGKHGMLRNQLWDVIGCILCSVWLAVSCDSVDGRVQDHRPTWIRNVARGQMPTITTAQNCNAVTSCTEAPTPICPYIKVCPDGTSADQLVWALSSALHVFLLMSTTGLQHL